MIRCDEDSWEATEFELLGQHIDRPDDYLPGFYKPGFKEWLFLRPLLWRRFSSSALRAARHKNLYDFSALTLVRMLLFQSTENDPDYLCSFKHIDYCFVSELGYLLIELYPETGETLINGESKHPWSKQVIDVARFIEYPTTNLPAFLDSELDAMHDIDEYRVTP